MLILDSNSYVADRDEAGGAALVGKIESGGGQAKLAVRSLRLERHPVETARRCRSATVYYRDGSAAADEVRFDRGPRGRVKRG